MSKITDWIVNKFGEDKVMHFLGGAWITSVFTPLGIYWTLGGVLFVLIISLIKELFLDSFFDIKDIVAAMFGSLVSVILFIVISLLFL